MASGVSRGFRSSLITEVTLMTSQAKIDSCRKNGSKSRGPKTPETRERVCMNAYKHGMRSKREEIAREQSCEFENRKLKWMAKVDVSDDMGEFLAYHTVRAQVEIEQADQAIAERIQTLHENLEDDAFEAACELGRRLMYTRTGSIAEFGNRPQIRTKKQRTTKTSTSDKSAD